MNTDSASLLGFYGSGSSCHSFFHTVILMNPLDTFGATQTTSIRLHSSTSTCQRDIYHVILGFAISNNHSDTVLDLALSVGGGEDVVHGKLDGPASLQNRQKTVMTWWSEWRTP